MTSFRAWRKLRLARRITQGVSLAAFMWLLLETRSDVALAVASARGFHAPGSFFLEIDPLAALLTILSTGALYRDLLWAVVLLVLTIFLGRFFCGWICPLGTINQLVSAIRNGHVHGKGRLDRNRHHPRQRWKYLVLATLATAALFGSLQAGVLDPIALLARTMSVALLPAWDVAVHGIADWAVLPGDAGMHVARILAVRPSPAHFEQAVVIALLFIAIVAANRWMTRFWCRVLCPLGALLGVFSRHAILGLEKRPSLCTDCNRCALHCQGADDPQPGYTWRQSECHLCLNCVADCPEAGIAFRFFPDQAGTRQTVDVRRRALMGSAVAGIAAVPLLRMEAAAGRGNDPALVRPPGSRAEADFLARCIRCGACMNACPNEALHPTLFQAGLEGVWSPILLPRIGYCEPACVLCGEVCPTGAIAPVTLATKGWTHEGVAAAPGSATPARQPLRIGTAFYDQGRCLPWAMATECIVCEEWCPVSPKAVYFEEADVQNARGEWVHVRRPHIDPLRCVGCGACTFACPVKGAPAVYITNTGETRNPRNALLLNREEQPVAPRQRRSS